MICPHCGGLIAWKNIDANTKKHILNLHKKGGDMTLDEIRKLCEEQAIADGEFYAAARTLLPALLKVAEAVRDHNDCDYFSNDLREALAALDAAKEGT